MDAVKREVTEELGVEIEPKSLQFVIEGAESDIFSSYGYGLFMRLYRLNLGCQYTDGS